MLLSVAHSGCGVVKKGSSKLAVVAGGARGGQLGNTDAVQILDLATNAWRMGDSD